MRASVGMPIGTAGRNPGIDLLRGMAILLVVLHHLGLRIPLKHSVLAQFVPLRLLLALNDNGYEAVFVFFVISGFLIAGNALRRAGELSGIALKPFYVRRFARIVPCLVVLVGVLSALHGLGCSDYLIHRAGQSLPRAVLAAFGLHLNRYEGRTGYLPGSWDVLWSLSIEEVFYICFPLACLWVRRKDVMALLLFVFALSLPFTHAALAGNEIWQEKAYLPGMAAIATGVVGALLVSAWQAPRWAVAAFSLFGGAALAAVFIWGDLLWHSLRDGYLLVLTWSALCLLLACDQRQRYATRTATRWLGWLRSWGRLSYEIYLSHMFVVLAVARLFHACGANRALGFLWYVPAVPLCWLLGKAVQRYLSAPCDRWLQRHWRVTDSVTDNNTSSVAG